MEEDTAGHGDHVGEAYGNAATVVGKDAIDKGKGDAFRCKGDAEKEEADEEGDFAHGEIEDHAEENQGAEGADDHGVVVAKEFDDSPQEDATDDDAEKDGPCEACSRDFVVTKRIFEEGNAPDVSEGREGGVHTKGKEGNTPGKGGVGEDAEA